MAVLLLAAFGALCAPLSAQDLLSDILGTTFKAKTLTAAEQDSILLSVTTTQDEAVSHRWRIEKENEHSIFRHSTEADYYIYDTHKKTRKPLCDKPVREAVMSPNGRYIAYVQANNLYLHKLDYGTEVPVTEYENPDILCGIADWLYEEEFGVTGLFAFSPDSKQIAFVRLDETDVPTFTWQEQLPATKSAQGFYPREQSLRYPKAGCANAKASVCVYDIYYKSIKTMQIGEMQDGYIPRLRWTNPIQKGKETIEAELAILKLNRDQNRFEVLLANPKSTVCHRLYLEESKDCYINYDQFDEWQWLSDNRMLVVHEQSGWRQVYLYSAQGIKQRQLTRDGMDITRVYGLDEKTQTLYYQAAVTPMTRQCFMLNIKKGEPTPITAATGMASLRMAADWAHAVECYEDIDTPNRYTLLTLRGGKVERGQVIEDNHDVLTRWQESGLTQKEFFTFTTERGDVLNAWRILPPHFDEHRQYPVVLMQYSGPESQRVLCRWKKGFGHYLASRGFIVINSDGRGTGARGRLWRAATYMQLGQKEAQDQLSTAQYAATLPYVNRDRISMMGWSYGGFQTLMTLALDGQYAQKKSGYTPLLHSGIAIAPVTDYRLYDSAYTERYMRRPQVNEGGYKACDLSTMAADIQGELLLIHGLADDNVHAQHSLVLINALVEAGKQFDMQLYPDDNHFLRQRSNYEHVHRTVMRFLQDR